MLFRHSLIKELISTAAGAFLILIGIVIAQRAGNLVRLAAKGILPNDAITTMLGFNMVKFLPMVLSLALFLAVLMTLSRWYRDSEMVIWFSGGLSLNHWVRPVLTFIFPVILFILILSLFVMPWATSKGELYRTQLESRDDLATISPGVFKESANGERVFFMESFDELGNVVKNIFVQTLQHQKLGVIVAAEGSRYTEKNGDNFVLMENGKRYEGSRGSAEFSTTAFEKYAIRIEANEAKERPPSTQSKPTSELVDSINSTNNAELQWRIAIPISALILCLLAIPLSALDPRAGRSANFVLALIIYIIYNNLLSIFQAWVAQGKLNTLVGLWPVHLFFLLLTIYMFYRRGRQLPILPSIFSMRWLKKRPSSALSS
ncbi:LPS export ABC transporter permease LptF [Methylotenera mobilis]|jgi:lipopolysaccharide export system permease protein|uniref:LPS export ABC transporter permease LptF n=1 Tax=Methylotenera mobilis TaxID=359408 RepID=UPI000375D37F|nr:LPS export ABC transporter permease LptF [Methylotenera mobilis]PPC97607.1 MAG: LPS export ABC transporter permease LptF [Methylotenera sp.]